MPAPQRPIRQLWGLYCNASKAWMHVVVCGEEDEDDELNNNPATITAFLTREAAYEAANRMIEDSDHDPEVVRLI